MIPIINININGFVKQYLPPHKRQANRLGLLGALLYPFTSIWNATQLQVAQWITLANCTGETLSVVWILNAMLDPALARIYIQNAPISGVGIGLTSPEWSSWFAAGIEATEPAAFGYIPLPGESLITGTYSFVVYVPMALFAPVFNAQVAGIVEKYRFLGHNYIIKSY
jgi:hypothetical protein